MRDGEQSPGCSMNLHEKIRLARQLETLGVDVIEAGFPIASEGDFQSVKAIAEVCKTATIAALCRTTEIDIVRAARSLEKAKHKRIHTFVAWRQRRQSPDILLTFAIGNLKIKNE